MLKGLVFNDMARIGFLVFLVKILSSLILPIPDSFPLVQAFLCLTRSSIHLASLLLVSLFYMLSSKHFKWSYWLPPEYTYFFACLKDVLWTWNSKCCYLSPPLLRIPQWQQLVLFMWYPSQCSARKAVLCGCAVSCGWEKEHLENSILSPSPQ